MSLSSFFILFFIGFLIGFMSRLFYTRMTGKPGVENIRTVKKVIYISPKFDEPLEPDTKPQEIRREREAG